VPARVNAVAYFRIVDPKAAIVQIENFMVATSQIAQTTLRSVLGPHMLDELLSEREKINSILQGIIDEQTAPLLEIGGSNSSTIIFPAPIDLIKPFLDKVAEPRKISPPVEPERRQAA